MLRHNHYTSKSTDFGHTVFKTPIGVQLRMRNAPMYFSV